MRERSLVKASAWTLKNVRALAPVSDTGWTTRYAASFTNGDWEAVLEGEWVGAWELFSVVLVSHGDEHITGKRILDVPWDTLASAGLYHLLDTTGFMPLEGRPPDSDAARLLAAVDA